MDTHSPFSIVGISGSLRNNSSCSLVLREAQRLSKGFLDIEIYEGISHLPLFDDMEPSPAVLEFKKKIQTSSGILICQPEYAFGVSGSLKNALDWTVGTGEFSRKPVGLITAATGGINAHEAMQKTLTAIDSVLSPDTQLLISGIKSKIDSSGQLKDGKLVNQIFSLLKYFEKLIHDTIPLSTDPK